MAAVPVVSVVIPCFNYGRYLGECLESVLGQVGAPSFEIVVVDDGSTDETQDVLSRFTDPRLRVVRKPNGGHVSAINTGLPLAQGRIVTRIDPDDRYHPHFLATAVARLDAHPDAAMLYGRAQLIDAMGRPAGGVTDSEPHHGDFVGNDFPELLTRNFICAPTVAARREAWMAHLPVPDGLAFHDWYFTLLTAREHPACFVDDVLADYRIHGANHHTAIARNGAEERSVIWMLDRVFSLPEAGWQRASRRPVNRANVYAAHYLDFAEKYFGFGMNGDARRCYLAAIGWRPGVLTTPGIARRFAATVVGRGLYERAKRVWKPAVPR